MSVWRNNPDLIARLTAAQNHPANIRQDIMTFAGFCDSREELLAHVERAEARVDAALGAAAEPRIASRRRAA